MSRLQWLWVDWNSKWQGEGEGKDERPQQAAIVSSAAPEPFAALLLTVSMGPTLPPLGLGLSPECFDFEPPPATDPVRVLYTPFAPYAIFDIYQTPEFIPPLFLGRSLVSTATHFQHR